MSGDASTMEIDNGDTLKRGRRAGMLLIQPDWDAAFTGKEDSVWISFKPRGVPATHGKISRERRTTTDLKGDDEFRVLKWAKGGSLFMEHKTSGSRTKFLGAEKVFKGLHLKAVNCIDVSSTGLGVSACAGNELKVWDTERGIARRSLEGHVDNVTVCKFFPSGVVVVTGGMDMRLRIWSAETGANPVTLVGHAGGISGVSIVDRGRNILSVARDGKCRLWDVGQNNCLHEYEVGNGIINGCDLQSVNGFRSDTSKDISDREIATEGQVVAIGCESGHVSLIDVRGRDSISSTNAGDAVNAVRWIGGSGSGLLSVGCEDGRLIVLDHRKFDASTPLKAIHDTASPVVSLLPVDSVRIPGGPGVIVGHRDGTCCLYGSSAVLDFVGEDTYIPLQLTGSDCDPIYGMATSDGGETVFTASRDGFIRQYDLLAA